MELIVGLFTAFGFLVAFLVWLLPIVLIGLSDRTSGGEKLAWILAVIFISWFAWIFYMLLAPLKSEFRRERHYRGYR